MRLLIVEDNKELAKELEKIFKREKFTVSIETDGSKAIDTILSENFDMIILDLMLPMFNGFQILKIIREEDIKTPVLILTARDNINDRVKGLDLGADDYLTKPFSTSELLARIRAVLRRSGEESKNVIETENLKLDLKSKEIFLDGKKLDLTLKEFMILEFLILNKNKPVSKFDIAEHIWGDSYDILSTSNFVEVHIKNIRKKLQKFTDKKIITTVRGVGYKIK